MDQLAITVPADEDICPGPAIGERHHELLCVPERDDHSLTLRQQRIHGLRAFNPYADAVTQQANRSIADRGHAGKLGPRKQRLQHVVKIRANGL
ncbi:MAG TPA: hypothetical protein VJ805_11460 [Nitrospiraceae bacterium]|nr:hypothetical protein [Nitrospiraceae bacterium]